MSLSEKTMKKAKNILIELDQDGESYIVRSQSDPTKTYNVSLDGKNCTCLGNRIHRDCKHREAWRLLQQK